MIDFNKKIDRTKNDSRKWSGRKKFFGNEDVIPMWVADMDIETPEFILDGIKNKVEEKIFGYTMESYEYKDSLVKWIKKRHNYTLLHDKIAHSPTVITSLNILIKILTKEGDNILIQSPSYPQFVKQVKGNKRNLLINKLINKNMKYEIDFKDFETKAKNAKLFILCNPQNPTGKVFTKKELNKIAEICLRYNVKIISDEIHSDLILEGKHTPIESLNQEIAKMTYTCFSSTKTFNLAGIQSSFVSFPTVEEKEEFVEELSLIGVHEPNSFCMSMVIKAYNNGENWLKELLLHIESNINYAINYIEKNIPKIKVNKPEATYLLWLDMSNIKLQNRTLKEILVEDGGIGLTMGEAFLDENFARMNVACPRYLLEVGLEGLKKAAT